MERVQWQGQGEVWLRAAVVGTAGASWRHCVAGRVAVARIAGPGPASTRRQPSAAPPRALCAAPLRCALRCAVSRRGPGSVAGHLLAHPAARASVAQTKGVTNGSDLPPPRAAPPGPAPSRVRHLLLHSRVPAGLLLVLVPARLPPGPRQVPRGRGEGRGWRCWAGVAGEGRGGARPEYSLVRPERRAYRLGAGPGESTAARGWGWGGAGCSGAGALPAG